VTESHKKSKGKKPAKNDKASKKKQKLVKQLCRGSRAVKGAGLKMSNKRQKSSIKAKSKIVCTCPKGKTDVILWLSAFDGSNPSPCIEFEKQWYKKIKFMLS